MVTAVLTNSPAASSRAIHIGDQILSVAEADNEFKTTTGLALADAVRLIRGPKGSTIRLTILPAGKNPPDTRVITLTRGTILDNWGDGALLEKGAEAPNIRMIALPGKQEENLADFRGKIVVLEFWATWCPPCQPQMERLQTYPDTHPEWSGEVVLIGASVDERAEIASKHVARKGWNKSYNVWVTKDAVKAFHINALPTIYIIDQDGKVAGTNPSDGIPVIVNRLLKSLPEQ